MKKGRAGTAVSFFLLSPMIFSIDDKSGLCQEVLKNIQGIFMTGGQSNWVRRIFTFCFQMKND
jgi:hypothetical protein